MPTRSTNPVLDPQFSGISSVVHLFDCGPICFIFDEPEEKKTVRLSRFTDYSLRILIYLGSHDGDPTTTHSIAESYGISFHHVAKAAQFLSREGFVAATRGRSGGLRLARHPKDISLGEVVRKADRGTAFVECMQAEGNCCAITGVCELAGILDEARRHFYEAMDRKTLADITRNRADLRRALQIS